MLDRFLAAVSPHSCCGCGEVGGILCSSCAYDITTEPFSSCIFCLRPTRETNLCTSCRADTTIESAWCAVWRDGVVKASLDLYKFEAVREGYRPFVEILDQMLPRIKELTVTAVPTSSGHIRRLGYDHAALVARAFAKRRSLPYSTLLQRNHNQMQHLVGRTARKRQAERLFAFKKPARGSFLLVDDILTTGATIEAAARKLKEAGADKVYVAIIARQPLD